jgi:hypothetical protein
MTRRVTFWENLERDAVRTESGCLEWPYYRNEKGYGRVTINDANVYVHRLVWAIANGAIPEGLQVLHRCDNPPCFELGHLFLGTQADNMRDAAAKGRLSDPRRAAGSVKAWRARVAAGVPAKHGRFECGHARDGADRRLCPRCTTAEERKMKPRSHGRFAARDLPLPAWRVKAAKDFREQGWVAVKATDPA